MKKSPDRASAKPAHAKFEQHVPSDGNKRWNQSYYFNAYDPASSIGCFIRLGFMENMGLSNCWFIFFRDGKPIFQRLNAQLPYTNSRLEGGVELAGVKVTSLEPLKKARIEFREENFSIDLTWESMQPMMDSIAISSDQDGAFARDMAHAHLEGSCRVTGSVVIRKSDVIAFQGTGARDVAAGARDWDALRHYRLAMPIFEDGFTIVGIHGISHSGTDTYMKMLYDGQQWNRIDRMNDSITFESDDMTARIVDWDVSLSDGRHWNVKGTSLFRCFIPVDMFMLAEHMMKFTRSDGMIGYGLVECGYRFPWCGNGVVLPP